MACGRPKNLETGAGNPLCGPPIRRRNFLTTGNGSRRRGNPEPPARGKPRATRQRATPSLWRGETRSHRRRGNSEPRGKRGNSGAALAIGMTSGHWSEEIPKATATGQPGPSGLGEIRSHPATGYLGAPWAQRDPEPPGAGRPQATGLGKPRATRRRDTSGPTGLRGTRRHRRGEPSDHWSGENPKPRRRDTSGPLGLGESRSHPAKASLVPPAQEESPPPARGKPRATRHGNT